MGGSSGADLHGHMGGLVWFMEIGSVLFVLAVFVFYFILKLKLKKKKANSNAQMDGKKTSGK